MPAPDTAAGYAAMMRALPTLQWGAADVAITEQVGPWVVWLWGDTLSGVTSWDPWVGRMVHSSATTQRDGHLRVSHGGAQLLPDDPDGSYFWIHSARAVDSYHLHISADHVRSTGPGPWDFEVIGFRTASALVSGGDVTFDRWTGGPDIPKDNVVTKDGGEYAPWSQTVSEVATGRTLVTGLPHAADHFSYAAEIHPELPLASGRTLMTVCHNGTLRRYADYGPLFFEVALSGARMRP